MKTYRSKPMTVQAEQFIDLANPPEPVYAVSFHPIDGWRRVSNGRTIGVQWRVDSYNGPVEVSVGDFIVMEPDGVRAYPCKPGVFRSRWEEAPGD